MRLAVFQQLIEPMHHYQKCFVIAGKPTDKERNGSEARRANWDAFQGVQRRLGTAEPCVNTRAYCISRVNAKAGFAPQTSEAFERNTPGDALYQLVGNVDAKSKILLKRQDWQQNKKSLMFRSHVAPPKVRKTIVVRPSYEGMTAE